MPELNRTADGHEPVEGMTIWVVCSGTIEKHVIKRVINQRKVEYFDPRVDGYEGARLTVVYADEVEANKAYDRWLAS
ncbi:MAG: hypothetical protein ACYS7Y_04300 [Planctomycetota bacterium]|jgi:hypothetical protein